MRLKCAMLCCLLAVTSIASADEKHNGNWWVSQNPTARLFYLEGFVDGASQVFTAFAIHARAKEEAAPKACKEYIGDLEDTAKEGGAYFNGVSYGQLLDGLNSFYADYRNRLIRIPVGISLVVQSIRGEDEATLSQDVDAERKKASD
jgi:hypothetical protein